MALGYVEIPQEYQVSAGIFFWEKPEVFDLCLRLLLFWDGMEVDQCKILAIIVEIDQKRLPVNDVSVMMFQPCFLNLLYTGGFPKIGVPFGSIRRAGGGVADNIIPI